MSKFFLLLLLFFSSPGWLAAQNRLPVASYAFEKKASDLFIDAGYVAYVAELFEDSTIMIEGYAAGWSGNNSRVIKTTYTGKYFTKNDTCFISNIFYCYEIKEETTGKVLKKVIFTPSFTIPLHFILSGESLSSVNRVFPTLYKAGPVVIGSIKSGPHLSFLQPFYY